MADKLDRPGRRQAEQKSIEFFSIMLRFKLPFCWAMLSCLLLGRSGMMADVSAHDNERHDDGENHFLCHNWQLFIPSLIKDRGFARYRKATCIYILRFGR